MDLETYKNKLRTFLLASTALVMGALYAFYVIFAGESAIEHAYLPISIVTLSLIYLIYRLYAYYKMFDFFMYAYACTIQMWLSYVEGSFDSPSIYWAFAFIVGIYILLGLKATVFYYCYFIFGQLALMYFDPLEVLYKSVDLNTKAFIFSVCYSLLLYFAIIQRKIFIHFQSLGEENDKNKTLLQVKGGLLHQINNPLSVVENLSKREEIKPDKMDMLRRSTDKISQVMRELNEVDSVLDLELKSYTDNTSVYLVKNKNRP